MRGQAATLLLIVTLLGAACGSNATRLSEGTSTAPTVPVTCVDEVAPDSSSSSAPRCVSPMATSNIADDSGMGTDAEREAIEALRGTGDLETVLTGKFDRANVQVEVRVENRIDTALEKPVTEVSVEGGVIVDPVSPYCERMSRSQLSCPYEGDVVLGSDPSPTALVQIQPTTDEVTVTAASRYTPSQDSDLSNNTKTITIKTG
jgi:hypothetical protein